MADDQLQVFKTKRATLKSAVTRHKTFLNQLDQDSEAHMRELEARMPKFESSLDEFNEIQYQIELLDDNEISNKSHEVERTTFENNYYSLKVKSQQILESRLSTYSTNNESSINHHSIRQNNLNHIKLPTLSLPSFSGEYDQWLNFYDTFKSLINENQDLSEIQKFHYLKSSLKGDAALVVQSIEVSTDNYQVAWNLLRDRFENKALITQNHVKALFELNTINKESHESLQSLLNNTLKHLRALKMLQKPSELYDTLLIYLISSKVDPATRRDWEKFKSELHHLPRINSLTDFLTKKCQLLESISPNTKPYSSTVTKSHYRAKLSAHLATEKQSCKYCKANHPLYLCKGFLDLPVPKRITEASKLNLCKNCLRHNHLTRDCNSPSTCKKCHQRHNTLLHLAKEESQSNGTSTSNKSSTSSNPIKSITTSEPTVGLSSSNKNKTDVLLPTAIVHVTDKDNNKVKCRILLDSASQSNFITQQLFNTLGINGNKVEFPIAGINNLNTHVVRETKIKIESLYNAFNITISCLVLPEITQYLPQNSFDTTNLNIPKNIQLPDNTFNKSGKVDILLGAELFWKIICIGQISLGRNRPVAQKTHFGWIISGPVIQSKFHYNYRSSTHCSINSDNKKQENTNNIQRQLSLFWRLEEINNPNLKTKEEQFCETFFEKTTTRNNNGKFVVHLPFKDNIKNLGESFTIAKRRLHSLEKRFNTDSIFKQQYSKFIHEYIDLDHMTCVEYTNDELSRAYFLPHQAVIKPSSNTTKVRVVFDGSCTTTSNLSLNDTLMIGPTVQSDLFTILVRFRLHRYAFTCDCEKMYRQVIILEDDRFYQNILWRNNTSEPIKTYQLNTVTYGTSAAPYLATRCLLQISLDNSSLFPRESQIIKNDFYVDDLISGIDNDENGIKIVSKINQLLSQAGFQLRKWASNEPKLLQNLENKCTEMHFNNEDNTVKTLGLTWNAELDIFQFPVHFEKHCSHITKRTILSQISKIFDPLGLIGPTVVIAKIILQKLWQYNLDWDESIPTDLFTIWEGFYKELQHIQEFTIGRHVLCINPVTIQLHAFCDASETSYGTCIYLRSSDIAGNCTVNLLCAKSRVAPLKNITIPRLELCAAYLLAIFIDQFQSKLDIQINNSFYWSDSTIVLSWLKKPPSQLKTFVGNRVAEINRLRDISQWHHVQTSDNPADIISRGMSPRQLSNSDLWWHGPVWLSEAISVWPLNNIVYLNNNELPEIKPKTISLLTLDKKDELLHNLIHKYSSLVKLKNVLEYCIRFAKNCSYSREKRLVGSLTVCELNESLLHLLRITQHSEFFMDISNLKRSEQLSSKSKLLCLNPFLDDKGILRVGGRLQNAQIPYNQKHPYLLPSKHHLTKLIIEFIHKTNFHAGPQLVLSILRQNYWPISGLVAVKRVLRGCVTCKRMAQQRIEPIMADLPKSRVVPSRPFYTCAEMVL